MPKLGSEKQTFYTDYMFTKIAENVKLWVKDKGGQIS